MTIFPHTCIGNCQLHVYNHACNSLSFWCQPASAITLILRHESNFFQVELLVLTLSACPCKNYVPKCSQIPYELDFYLVCNLGYTKFTNLVLQHYITQRTVMNSGSQNYLTSMQSLMSRSSLSKHKESTSMQC